jgi:hypothetical protein
MLEQRADRLTLVEPEAGDVDEADDVRYVGAESGDDLASVGVGRPRGYAAAGGASQSSKRIAPRRAPSSATRSRSRSWAPK